MPDIQGSQSKHVRFPVNEHGWVLLFQKLGKTVIRAEKVIFDKNKRVADETSGHRMFHIECEGGVKVKSKLYDTSSFVE